MVCKFCLREFTISIVFTALPPRNFLNQHRFKVENLAFRLAVDVPCYLRLRRYTMPSCQQVMRDLFEMMHKNLPPERQAAIQAHLERCPTCPKVTRICDVWVIEERQSAA